MATNELKYVKTGAVPGRDDLLIQGGDINRIRLGPVPLFYVPLKGGALLVDSSFAMEDAETLGVADAVKREMPAEDPLAALGIRGDQTRRCDAPDPDACPF